MTNRNHGWTRINTDDLKGHGFSHAVADTQTICHHEGASAPEGSALLTGGADATL